MSNIIQLLPDSVANQIAAGEVIQRPASVIKELMENAVDAGATDIQIITKDAGKTLIQVIDNGSGMTDTDARMAFERHATSKIKSANDLFALSTMGFRGEALASIAAIAHVELKTRREEDDLGVHICIAGTEIESQEAIQCSKGSQFIVKNLFYNVPARRRFLKENSTELKNITSEFHRVVLANPHIGFKLYHNDVLMFNLPIGNRLQRVAALMGKRMGNQLIPLETDAIMVKISGYIGKPEGAKKTMGDQFFFVNNRFMKHPYLHKAVMNAYDNILQPGTTPAYFIYIEVDPQTVDVNIHPTKTEIKFEDERAIWQILSSSVRESIGKFNLMPSIDFDTADSIDMPVFRANSQVVEPSIETNPFYNPFEEEKNRAARSYGGSMSSHTSASHVMTGWETLYHGGDTEASSMDERDMPFDHDLTFESEAPMPEQQTFLSSNGNDVQKNTQRFFQLKNKYILTTVKSGLMMIDQRRAHERIVFERFMASAHRGTSLSQKCLFPEELHYSPEEAVMVQDLQPDLFLLGLELIAGDDGQFLVQSIPAGMEQVSAKQLIDGLLSDYSQAEVDLEREISEQLATSMAKRAAMPYGKMLTVQEMSELFDQLFACQIPNFSPSGKPIISIFDNDEIDKRFA